MARASEEIEKKPGASKGKMMYKPPVVLYCACQINEIAERAAFLEFRGYRNIFVLLEGYPGWVKRRYPLETGRR
jgi:rhodanese-related sulfurtransferase